MWKEWTVLNGARCPVFMSTPGDSGAGSSLRSTDLEHSLSPAPVIQGVATELSGVDNWIPLAPREVYMDCQLRLQIDEGMFSKPCIMLCGMPVSVYSLPVLSHTVTLATHKSQNAKSRRQEMAQVIKELLWQEIKGALRRALKMSQPWKAASFPLCHM